jgi:hypothetical protein
MLKSGTVELPSIQNCRSSGFVLGRDLLSNPMGINRIKHAMRHPVRGGAGYVAFGSIATEMDCPRDVRFSP